MQTIIPTQTEKMPDHDSLLLASLILRDVNQLVRGIQTIVAVLLRYVSMGASVADRLMGMVMPGVSEDY